MDVRKWKNLFPKHKEPTMIYQVQSSSGTVKDVEASFD